MKNKRKYNPFVSQGILISRWQYWDRIRKVQNQNKDRNTTTGHKGLNLKGKKIRVKK